MNRPRCRRCQDWATDPNLIRDQPLTENRKRQPYTITLCRHCHDECTALMASKPAAPYYALKKRGVSPSHPLFDDYLQQLRVVYWRCCVDYKSQCGVEFSTYALDSLCQTVKTIVRRSWSQGFSGLSNSKVIPASTTSLDCPRDQNDDRFTFGRDILSQEKSPVEQAAQSNLHECLQRALDRIPPRHALVLRERFLGQGKTLDEVAAILGVTRERVRQIQIVAMQMLRRQLQSTELANY